MQLELDEEDKKLLKEIAEDNKVHKWMKAKQSMQFQVGDILIKKCADYRHAYEDGTKEPIWKIETINNESSMAQRYVYVYEDEFGIGYIQQLCTDGQLSYEKHCLVDFDYDYVQFEVDPEYASNILLGIDFDIKDVHRKSLEQRKIIIKMNRQIGVKPKSLKQFNDFFKGMKSGTKFWITHDFVGRYPKECELRRKKKYVVTDLKKDNYTFGRWQDNFPNLVDDVFAYRIYYDWKSNSYSQEQFVFELHGGVLFKTKPAQEEKG